MTKQPPSDIPNESTFRKRRLSIPLSAAVTVEPEEEDGCKKKQQRAAVDLPEESKNEEAASSPPPEDSNHNFRKRRLSLTKTATSPADDDAKKVCVRATEEQTPTRSRTVHAGELLMVEPPATAGPNWTHRLTVDPKTEVEKLPFPPDMLGTFSCHGIEPIEVEVEEVQEEHYIEALENNGQEGSTQLQLLFDSESLEESQRLEDAQIVSFEEPQFQNTFETTAKINQDRGGVVFPYGGSDKMALFAVYDGHGPGGETISQFSLNEIQRRLEEHEQFPANLKEAMMDTFLTVDRALHTEPSIDAWFAGSTACVALLQGTTLTLANAGDSRAVCARRNVCDGKISALDLTSDQNPDVPLEMARIQQRGGFVTLPPAPGLSARVWLDEQCTQVGLAMARSLGDHAASTVGVIAEPVVTTHSVQPTDEFMILATDGVWEFLSSQEAVDIVESSLDKGASTACQMLIEVAANRWREEEGAYRDDITAIVVKLQNIFAVESKHESD